MAKKKNRKRDGKRAREGMTQANGLGLGRLLPKKRSDQFLLGLLLGAGASYLLSDAELRGKLIKSGLKLYAGLAGGFEEMKEQVADMKAEIEAEESAA